MDTVINLSVFDKAARDNQGAPVDSQILQTFAAQNNFTFTPEMPYNSQALGSVVMAAKPPVMRNVIAGRMHNLPIEIFQRFYIHMGSGQYRISEYDRMTMAVITLPYACPEIIISSQLASIMYDTGILQDANYPGQRITTNDALADDCLSIFAPTTDATTVRDFLQASGLAETILRSASFCNLRFTGNLCIVYMGNERYIKNRPLSASIYVHGFPALDAITQSLSKGLAAASLQASEPLQHRLRISNAPDWKVFGWGLLVMAAPVAIITYLIVQKSSASSWVAFGVVIIAIIGVCFTVISRNSTSRRAQRVQKLRARYGDVNMLPADA